MTEVEIIGGPLDGQSLDTAGNPERGEKVAHRGSFYRLYERQDGRWVGVWGGYLIDDPEWADEELTDREVAKLADALREHEETRRRRYGPHWWGAALTVAVFAGSAATGVGIGLFLIAALGWAIEAAAGWAGGWVNLCLALALVGFVAALALAIANPETIDELETK
jgi:hypothetical protein